METHEEQCIRITAKEVASFSELERRLLFQFEFGSREWQIGELRSATSSVNHRGVGALECCNACERLCAKGIVRCTFAPKTVTSRRFKVMRSLDMSATRVLLGEALVKGWCPVFSSWTYDSRREREKMAALYSLLCGGKDYSMPKDAWSLHEMTWINVARFANMVGPDDVVPKMAFPLSTGDFVFRVLLSVLFCQGLDVSSLMEDWHRHVSIRAKGSIGMYSAIEYAAMCVWTGHLDWLDTIAGKVQNNDVESFVAACRDIAKGDFQSAEKHMSFMEMYVSSREADYESNLASMPASHLLALFVTALTKPKKTRIARLAAKFYPYKESFVNRLPTSAQIWFSRRLKNSFSYFKLVTFPGYVIPVEDWDSPACESGYVVRALLSDVSREDAEQKSQRMLMLAKKAMEQGCPTLAGAYLAAFGWTFKGTCADEAEHLAEEVTARGGVWLRAYEKTANPWKLVVEAFDKCLPKSAKESAKSAGQAKSGRIVWSLNLIASNYRDLNDREHLVPEGIYSVWRLTPCFRGPRSPDDGSKDRAISFKALTSGKYDAVLCEADNAVMKALQKDNPYGLSNPNITPSVMEALCGHYAVSRCHRNSRDKLVYDSVSLERRELPLAVKSAADGGFSISIEPWCVNVDEPYAIRMGATDHELLYYAFPKAALAAMEVFSSFGNSGMIEIPKEGVEAMRPLLPRMGALAPIQGELSAMGGGAGLERIPGNTVPLMRIEFEEGVLSLSMHVKPLAESDLLFVPGAGQPERLVAHNRASAVLVRDLAAEKAAADRVRTALSDFESWAIDDGAWRIDSLVNSLKALAALKDLGDAVSLEWRKGRRVTISAPKPGAWKLSAVGGTDFWFSVSGEFKLDSGRMLSIAELIAAFRNRNGEFVPFGDGEYLRLTSSLAKRIEALDLAGRVKGKVLEVPPAAIPMLDGAFAGDEDMPLPRTMEERADAIRAAFERKVEPPARLKAELRPYQRDGYEWLSRLASCGLGTCLADDMGLGKTVQVLALLLERSQDGASLVVAPASVCGNWRSEIARFAPTLRTVMAWDEKADEMDAVNAAGPGDVVIAGYGLLVSRQKQFSALSWNGVVLDEAQAIKNETSKRAQAVRRLKAKFRVAATGTPVENRLTELWSISEFLNPGLLGSVNDFARRFTVDGRATPALKRLVSPLIMRRVKRDVLDDLPEKTEITIPVILGDDERAGYETCRRIALETLEDGGAENRISILAELMRLRRYCCHPSLVLGEAAVESAKMDALLELLGGLRENRHRALVFSQFTDYLAIVRRAIDAQGWSHLYLDGGTPAAERSRLVESFQRGDGDFFLISLKAGGMGLNLTAANYVILLDPWWNPAVENQAADRVHRIGQKNPVTVYRLIASDTVEERVLELHREKKSIAEDVLDGASSTALTPDELMRLFR